MSWDFVFEFSILFQLGNQHVNTYFTGTAYYKVPRFQVLRVKYCHCIFFTLRVFFVYTHKISTCNLSPAQTINCISKWPDFHSIEKLAHSARFIEPHTDCYLKILSFLIFCFLYLFATNDIWPYLAATTGVWQPIDSSRLDHAKDVKDARRTDRRTCIGPTAATASQQSAAMESAACSFPSPAAVSAAFAAASR